MFMAYLHQQKFTFHIDISYKLLTELRSDMLLD